MKQKTALICISDTYLSRAQLLADQYKKMGDEVVILTPDFSHRTKSALKKVPQGTVLLPHRPYQKNLSWQRLLGHAEFARKARRWLEEWKPERIHCLVPANSLCREMAGYKKDHPDTELIFDINDLWPESLPIGWLVHTPPAWFWKRLRNSSLDKADRLLMECELFHDEIGRQTGLDSQVLYWASTQKPVPAHPHLSRSRLDLCYLGFVNNIIDLDCMEELLKNLSARRKVRLHLIAQGQRKNEMVERLKKVCEVIDYGPIYDQTRKQEIFDLCAFGLNIMKPAVQAGLSMKTLDYLQAGLPVINSLKGDAWTWIEEEQCGVNIDRDHLERTADQILSLDYARLMEYRKNASQLYQEKLSLEAFEQTFSSIMNSDPD